MMDIIENIQWGTVIYQLVTFIILLVLLRRYALKPLMGIMQSRQDKIADDLATAEKHRTETQAILAEQKTILEQARKDATQVLENARATSEKQSAETIKLAKQEVEDIKRLAQAEIVREKQKAVEELRAQVGALTVMLATKVIEKELDEKQQEKLIAGYLQEVGNKK
jgi:F-type H+-transporting ATPase subunit b